MRLRTDRGASAVEMGLLLPLLILFFMGIVDVGRVMFTFIGLQDAAQEGAVFASYHPSDAGLIRERVKDSVASPTLQDGDVAVVCSAGSGGDPGVEVTVTHDLPLITPVVGGWFGGSVTLSRTVHGTIYSTNTCTGGGP